MSKRTLVIGAFTLLALGGAAGYAAAAAWYGNVLGSVKLVLDNNTPYSFVRPLLLVSVPDTLAQGQFDALKRSVEQTVSAAPRGAVARYSFYLRDLTNGRWLGINEDDTYDPGSLLKVVAAIAAYKQEESDPTFFEKRFTYTPELESENAQFPFAPPVSLKVGQSYFISDLIKEMLSDSDNAAKDTLLSSIDPEILGSVYTDLSIPKPSDPGATGYRISAYDYSRFFRILYYGTYNIPWSYSNEILEDLNQSTYTQGLVAGVRSGISVAHKYGEHVIGTNGTATAVELSDCGIVYDPHHPYFVCVMTEGPDQNALADVIAKISGTTYRYLEALK